MRRMPAISVLVPVRNALPWVRASFASLWRQTAADLEVVAVDDGSSDGSGEWLDREAARERRMRVVHTAPRGLPLALAAALAAARGGLIARHDADDVSHRRRFELQLAFLSEHPEVDLVGCRVRVFPPALAGAGMRRWAEWHNALLSHDAMERDRLVDSPLAHGTMLARREAVERAGGWRERGWPEDVDLWLRLFRGGARFAKLPQVLYGWRQHPGSATRHDPRYARLAFDALRLDELEHRFLRRRRAVTVTGVGASLERWRTTLRATGRRVHAVTAGRPSGAVVGDLEPPVVLVFGADPARQRWRGALTRANWRECRDFIFVS